MIITNQSYVDEMPIYEFETATMSKSLKGITGEATNTIEIGDKTYVKNWIPTDDERVDLAKGKRITVTTLKKLLPKEPVGTAELSR